MKCPLRITETEVVETRDSEDLGTIRRRRMLKMRKRFTTYERVENINLVVIKRTAEEQLDRDKLKRNNKILQKTKVSMEDIERIVTEIEENCRADSVE